MTDHERGCQGREYTCTCGYDAERDALIETLKTALAPFGSGGNWGVVKAMIVSGATVTSNGVDLAKWLTGLNAKADAALAAAKEQSA